MLHSVNKGQANNCSFQPESTRTAMKLLPESLRKRAMIYYFRLIYLGWMNGPTSKIIRVEKQQFYQLRFKCGSTLFLGFKMQMLHRITLLPFTLKWYWFPHRGNIYRLNESALSFWPPLYSCFLSSRICLLQPNYCVIVSSASYSIASSAAMPQSETSSPFLKVVIRSSHLHQQYHLLHHLRHFTMRILILLGQQRALWFGWLGLIRRNVLLEIYKFILPRPPRSTTIWLVGSITRRPKDCRWINKGLRKGWYLCDWLTGKGSGTTLDSDFDW